MKTICTILKCSFSFLIVFNFPIKSFPQTVIRQSASQCDLKFSEKNISSYAGFGRKVANAGDVNNDGFDDVIVGATVGRAYIFYGGNNMDDNADVILEVGGSVSSAGDVNNDGYDDVIVGDRGYNSNQGRAYIYYGGYTMDAIADVVVDGEGEFGNCVASAGDVNNDGYDDVIVGAGSYNSGKGGAFIYFGGSEMDNVTDLILENDITQSSFGRSVSSAGDVNNDGYDDMMVGAPGCNSFSGSTYIYFGSSILNNIVDLILEGENTDDQFGSCLAKAGDVNNDGYDDVVIGATGFDLYSGRGYLYFGGNIMNNNPGIIFEGGLEMGENDGFDISSAGDINNDGFDDIVEGMLSYPINFCRVFLGGEFMDSIPDIIIEAKGEIHENNEFGRSVSTAGDLNNDGFDDIIIGGNTSLTGRADIYFGSITPDSISDFILTGEGSGNEFGYSVSSAGDINKDGFDDIVVGARGYNFTAGRTYVYYGGISMDNKNDIIINGAAGNYDKLDVNNDGYYDVIIGSRIYLGGEQMDTVADIFLNGVGTYAGDVNNDGYDDVITGDLIYNNLTGRAYIYYGGSNMDNIADVILQGETTRSGFGSGVSSAGDINNDGFDDVLVGAYYFNDLTGRAYIYYGGENMDNIADIIMNGEEDHNAFGLDVSSAGDINNDGFDDFMVAAEGYKSHTGRVYLYFGSELTDNTADVIFEGEGTYNAFGLSISSAGDVNNDGSNDLLIGARPWDFFSNGSVYKSFAYLFYGGTLLDNIPDKIIEGEEFEDSFGGSVSSAGDVNNDGYGDIIIGAFEYPRNGVVYLFSGNPFVKQPASISTCDESIDTVSFSIDVENSLYFQWQVSSDSGYTFLDVENDDIYTGSKTINLKVIPHLNLSGNQYRCRVKKDESYYYSLAAVLNVYPLPTNTLSGIATICQGETTNLSLGFTGSPPWNYRLTNGLDTFNLLTNENSILLPTGTSGTYKVVSIRDANCLGMEASEETIITVNPLPSSILSGGTYLCEGDSTELTITFTGTPPWNYALTDGINSKDLIAFDSPNTISVDSEGIYKIIYLTDSNCLGNNLQGVSVVKINPHPTGLISGNAILCEGESTKLNVMFTGKSPWNYSLSDGLDTKNLIGFDSSFTIEVDSEGIYKIVALSDSNCIGIDLKGEAIVAINPLPTSKLTGGANLCEGDSIDLIINFTGNPPWNFTFSNGISITDYITSFNPLTIEVDSAGIFNLTSLHDANCIGKSLSGEAIVTISPKPTSMLCNNGSMCVEDSTNICILFSGNSPWNFTLSNGSSQTELITIKNPYSLRIDSIGNYKIIELHDKNCSGTEMSGEVEIKKCSLLNINEEEVNQIFPNPTDGRFIITNLSMGSRIIITSISGKKIYDKVTNSETVEIDLSNETSGIYLLNLITNNQMKFYKIVVK